MRCSGPRRPTAARPSGPVARATLCAGLLALALPGAASAFGGASLSGDSAITLTHSGSAYPVVSCAQGTHGFCTGRLTFTSGRRTLVSVPIAIRGNDSPSVQVPLSRRALALVRRSGRLKVKVTIRVHDTDGVWKTTVGYASLRAA